MPMSTNINGTDVPVDIAYGVCHQIVRDYDAGEIRGYKFPSGTTTAGLPNFLDFRRAVNFLEKVPFAGYIQTSILKEDGSGPSNITAGVYYRKSGGSRGGPISSVVLDLDAEELNNPAAIEWIKRNASSAVPTKEGGMAVTEYRIAVATIVDATVPEIFLSCVLTAREWCCQSLMFYVA